MKDNAVTACNGVEVYTNKIFELADEFYNTELDDKRREDIINQVYLDPWFCIYLTIYKSRIITI